MRKTTFKILALLMFFSIGTMVMGQIKYSVTFKVNMSTSEDFNPSTDDVYMSGSFTGWAEPGSDTSYRMTTTLQLMVYELTLEVDEGDAQYKYFRVIDDSVSWENGEWEGGDNRMIVVNEEMTFDDVWGVDDSGIFDSKAKAPYTMYPNPVGNTLNISDLNGVNKIVIYDVSGKLIESFEVESHQVSVNTSNLNVGVYIVSFHTESGILTSRFIRN